MNAATRNVTGGSRWLAGLGFFLVWAGCGRGADTTVDFGGIELRFPVPEGMTESARPAPAAQTDASKPPPSIHTLARFRTGDLSAFLSLSKDDRMDHRFVTPDLLKQLAEAFANSSRKPLDDENGLTIDTAKFDEGLLIIPRMIKLKPPAGPAGPAKELNLWVHAYARINGRLVLLDFFGPYKGQETMTKLVRMTRDYVNAVRKLNGDELPAHASWL